MSTEAIDAAIETARNVRDFGGYRGFLTTQAGPGWLTDAVDQVGSWLRWKKLDADLETDSVVVERERILRIRHHRKDGEDAFRLVLSEDNSGGHWTTTLMFVAGPDGGWVSTRVANDGRKIAAAPRIARDLLDTLDLRDGGRRLATHPWIVRGENLDELLEAITGDRRGAIFVAGTDGNRSAPRFADYVTRVSEWTNQAVGLATVAVLDPVATSALSDEADGVMRVAPWTVRTFRPGLDPASPLTLRGHRTLGTATLARERDAYLARIIGLFARTILDEQPEPGRAAVWRRTFDRLDSRDAVDALELQPVRAPQIITLTGPEEAPPAPADFNAAFLELERVRTTLAVPDLSDQTLLMLTEAATAPRPDARQLAEAQRQLDLLQDQADERDFEIEERKQEAWDARQDAVDLAEEIERLERRNRNLARLLAEQGIQGVWAAETSDQLEEPDAPERAGSWQDLVNRRDAWGSFGVQITADPEVMLELDLLDLDGRALDACWRGLRALAGYARAKRDNAWVGGFGKFLDDQPSGYPTFSRAWYAPSETKETMARWGHERNLPVPISVDPAGHRVMEQHLKLARIANRDPRLYFCDDTNGPTCSVIVGYIGPHLTNTNTARLN